MDISRITKVILKNMTFFNQPIIINPPFTRGGVKITPPPRFFSNLEKTGKNFDKIFFLPEPNSFPDILKKKSCKSVKRLGHSNYVLEVYGGGVIFYTSHFFYLLVHQGGGDFDPPPVEFLFTDRF